VSLRMLGGGVIAVAEAGWIRMLHEGGPSATAPGLPMAQLDLRPGDSSSHYVVTAVDVRGRLADRSGLQALAWPPGHLISIQVTPVTAIVKGCTDGPHAITRQGHLRLRSSARHALGLHAGDRVLLVAQPEYDRLVIYPIPVLEATLQRHDLLPGSGDRA